MQSLRLIASPVPAVPFSGCTTGAPSQVDDDSFQRQMGGFSGYLMSSAGIQKLFCGIYSTFKCSFDEFVGEKLVSLSYSSAILGPPPLTLFEEDGPFNSSS